MISKAILDMGATVAAVPAPKASVNVLFLEH